LRSRDCSSASHLTFWDSMYDTCKGVG
jgi:hypothetical protein